VGPLVARQKGGADIVFFFCWGGGGTEFYPRGKERGARVCFGVFVWFVPFPKRFWARLLGGEVRCFDVLTRFYIRPGIFWGLLSQGGRGGAIETRGPAFVGETGATSRRTTGPTETKTRNQRPATNHHPGGGSEKGPQMGGQAFLTGFCLFRGEQRNFFFSQGGVPEKKFFFPFTPALGPNPEKTQRLFFTPHLFERFGGANFFGTGFFWLTVFGPPPKPAAAFLFFFFFFHRGSGPQGGDPGPTKISGSFFLITPQKMGLGAWPCERFPSFPPFGKPVLFFFGVLPGFFLWKKKPAPPQGGGGPPCPPWGGGGGFTIFVFFFKTKSPRILVGGAPDGHSWLGKKGAPQVQEKKPDKKSYLGPKGVFSPPPLGSPFLMPGKEVLWGLIV